MPTDDRPDYKSACYNAALADMQVSRDCFEGEAAVMEKRTTYLPRYAAENKEKYDARLKSSVFWEATRKAVYSLAGLVFRKDPVLGDDVPSFIRGNAEGKDGLQENIDNAGTAFDVFSWNLFLDGIVDGHTFILVDMPQALPQGSDLAAERAANRRPYWCRIKKGQVINWRSQIVDGKVVLTQATIEECLMVPDGDYKEKEVKRYRVLRPGEWHLYEKQTDKERGEDKLVLIAEGKTSLTEIPLVPVYTNKTGFLESRPPLLGLAKENLRHYRIQSSLDNVMMMCNIPQPVAIGRVNTKEPITLGGFVLDIPLQGDFKFVEPSGAAIGTTQAELDRSKQNMATLALSMIMDKAEAKQTATETVVDFAGETSELATWARSLEDGLEQALMFTAQYLGESTGGSVEVNKDFSSYQLSPQMFLAMLQGVEASVYPRDWFWNQLERADLIPADADKEKAAMDLEAEKRANADLGAAAMDNFNRNFNQPIQ